MPDAPVADAPAPKDTEITITTFPDGFPFTGRTSNAMLVAFQDGDGPWLSLTGTAGVYHATVTGQRYGVAVGCVISYGSNLDLYYQTVSDTTDVRTTGCPSNAGTVHLTVDLQGLGNTENGEVWFGSTVGFGTAGTPIEIDVPEGTVDVFARSYPFAPGPIVPTKVYRGPTVSLQADQSFQFDVGTLGKPLESHPLAFIGLDPAESVEVHSSYATPYSQVQWPLLTSVFTSAPYSYVTLDASTRQPTDLSNITATAKQTTADGQTNERFVRLAFTDPVAQTLTLPAAWTVVPPTLGNVEVSQATVTIPIAPATLQFSDYTASLSTSATAAVTARTLTLFVRSGWAGSQPSVTISTPDLSSLSGWSADMALTPGSPVDWSIERDDRTAPVESLPIDGRRIIGTRTLGQLPPATVSR